MNVLRKELNQLLLLLSSASDTFSGNKTLNFIDEFWGQFFATPVTMKGSNLSAVFNKIVLPIASALPKYFLAISSVRTIELGSAKAVLELPFNKGKVNTEKKLEST